MSNKVVLQPIQMITYSGSRTPAFVGALPTKSFTNQDGQFVGGGRIQSVDKDWIVKVPVHADGNGLYHSDAFENDTALSATRWGDYDQPVKWNFYLLDSKLRIIKTLYTNIVIIDTVDNTTIQDAENVSRAKYFPRTTSYVSHNELYQQLQTLGIAPDATLTIKGKGKHSAAGTDTFVSDTDTRVPDNLSKHSNSLAQAVADIALLGNPKRVLTINSIASVTADLTVPDNIIIDPQNGGMLDVSSGHTLTISKMTDPGNRQIITGLGNVRFTKNAVEKINVHWWHDAIGDCTKGWTQAWASANAIQGTVYIPLGNWSTTAGIVMQPSTSLKGERMHASFSNGTVLKLTADASTPYLLKIGETTYGLRIRDLTLTGHGTTGKTGLLMEGTGGPGLTSGDLSCDNVNFNEFDVNVNHHSLGSSWQFAQIHFNHCSFMAPLSCSVRMNSVNSQWTFVGCTFAIGATGTKVFDIQMGGQITIIGCECFGSTGFGDIIFHITGAHAPLVICGWQDEGAEFFLRNEASDADSQISIMGALIQGNFDIRATCTINSKGNSLLSDCFIFSGVGTVARVFEEGSVVRQIRWSGPPVNPPRLCADPSGGSLIFSDNSASTFNHITRVPSIDYVNELFLGDEFAPVKTIGHYSNTPEDKVVLWLGRVNADGTPLYGYAFWREYNTGFLHIGGNQVGFTKVIFHDDVEVNDYAYDATAWNGSKLPATLNAVRDIVENLLTLISGKASALSNNPQTGTSYGLQASDNNKTVTLSNASAITVTVGPGLGASFRCRIIQKGAGQVTFAAAGGATVNNRQGHTKTAGQHAVVDLVSDVADNLYLSGDTAA